MAKYVIKKLDDNSIIIFNLSKNNTFKNFHEIWEILTYINQNNQGKVYIDNLYNDSHKRFYNVELMQDLQFFRRKTKYIPSNIIKEANIWWGLNAYLIKDNFISYLICYGQIF